jgi:malonyl CoA-acyl carrier protein transacylase
MGEIAVVFPGQGSQRAGMARDFHDQFLVARARCSPRPARPCRSTWLPSASRRTPRLDLTEFTQPAIVTAEIAMLRALAGEYGLSPSHFGGHSLGEYTALCAAGALPLADAVRLVKKRGALMQQAVPVGQGAMSAVVATGVADAGLAALVADLGVDVANLNSLDQVVISGPAAGVEAAEKRISEQVPGVEVIRLNVSAPFHSRLMRGIEAEFRGELQAASPALRRVARATVVSSNLRGGFHTGQVGDLIEALTAQISGTVDWVANMRALSAAAPRIVELGPNRPLKRFFSTLGIEIVSIMNVKQAQKGLAS